MELGIKLYTLSSHTNVINCVAITNDNTKVVLGSADMTTSIWNLVDGS